jgi:DNA-binding NarL/FixJ family response regulator
MSGTPRTALIVDDHPAFRASARLLLESEGYEVVGEAGDGASAVAQVGQLRPALVLLDVQLPDIDGFAVAEMIEAGDTPAPMIVLVSSRDRSDFGSLVDRANVRGFISKGDLSGESLAELVR